MPRKADEPKQSDPAMEDAISALRTMMLASVEYRQAVAVKLNILVTDTIAMSYLQASDHPLTPGDLAHSMGMAPSSLTAVLDRLEAESLVERGRDPLDRRRVAVELTRAGHAALAWSREPLHAALSQVGELGQVAVALQSTGLALRDQIGALERSKPPRR